MDFTREIYLSRQAALLRAVSSEGIVLLPANLESPMSYVTNCYRFQQDGSFRYIFGFNRPKMYGVIDLDTAQKKLFYEPATLESQIWSGPAQPMEQLAFDVGVDELCDLKTLPSYLAEQRRKNRRIHLLPPYQAEQKIALSAMLETSIEGLNEFISPDLIFALAQLREQKSEEEIEEIEKAYRIGYQMHTFAMRMAKPGGSERKIVGAIEGQAMAMGDGYSFASIVSQRGERLHNNSIDRILQEGKMLLCDAGARSLSGYCSDHTRSYPIGGKFSDIQRDIYNAVLEAHNKIALLLAPGARYEELQRECLKSLGESLKSLGFLRGSTDEILSSGVVSMFMPHGFGHGLGLDVHDCEAFGSRTFDLSKWGDYLQKSSTCIFRPNWQLAKGTVLTNEPGLYFIPELIEKHRAAGDFSQIVNYDKVQKYFDFGGIRIEDNFVVCDDGARQIGSNYKNIPKTVREIEDFMLNR